MSNMRLKAIPAAMAAVGILTIGSGVSFAADQTDGTRIPGGVYAQGTFGTTNYIVVTKTMYAPEPTLAASLTGGFIAITLKPAQTAWGYALTDSNFSSLRGTHTLSHTLTTGTTTCSVSYKVVNDPAGAMTVSYGTATATPATATTTCKTAFANQTGLSTATFGGDQAAKSYTLIY